MRQVLLACMIAVFTVGYCNAQTLTGRVLDYNGDSIAFATVSYLRSDITQRTITTALGSFQFEGDLICDSDAILTIRSPAHNDAIISCDKFVSKGGAITLKQKLDSDVIIVRARKISQSFAPLSLNKLEVVTNPTSKGDPLVAVSTLPFSTNTNDSAEIALRGSPAEASRIYFNDIPIYEAIRGATIDRTTRGFSLFSPSIIGEVEIYPSNPPLYLGNTSAGAVRLLSDDVVESSSTIFLGTTGVGATTGLSDTGSSNTLQLFANYANLELSTQINPDLDETLESFESVNVGASAKIQTPGDGELKVFSIGDYEAGAFPIQILAMPGVFENENTTSITTANLEYVFNKIRIKTDFGYTYAKSNQIFESLDVENKNQYVFASGDISGTAANDRLRYRIGASHEIIDLISVGNQPASFFLFEENAPANAIDVEQHIKQTSLYGYGLFLFENGISISAGIRQNFRVLSDDNFSFQAGIAYEKGARHLSISAGRYHSFLLPESAFVSPTIGLRADQVAMDYSIKFSRGKFAFGVFAKNERATNGRERDIIGVESAITYSFTDAFRVTASYTRAIVEEEQFGQRFTGENSIDYFIRAGATYSFPSAGEISINYVTRNGTRFTEIIDGLPIEGSNFFEPVFANEINEGRLDRFASLDFSYSVAAKFFPGNTKPILFISAANLLDRQNPRSLAYSQDFSLATEQSFSRRTLTFGLVFQF